MTRPQYGTSALVSQILFRKETCGGITKCWLFSQAKKWWNILYLKNHHRCQLLSDLLNLNKQRWFTINGCQLYMCLEDSIRVVTKILNRAVAKISSCWVYAISRRGVVQQGSHFGSIFLLLSIRVAGAHANRSRRKSLAPGSYSDSPVKFAWPTCSNINNYYSVVGKFAV